MIDPSGVAILLLGFAAIAVVRWLTRPDTVLTGHGDHVILEESDHGGGSFETRLRLPCRTQISLSRPTSGIQLAKAIAGEDFGVDVGDAEFGKLVHLRGPEDLVVATLSHATREAVLRLVLMGGEVRPEGEVFLRHEGRLRRTRLLDDVVAVLAAVAKALTALRPDGIPAALAANAANDPEPGVRLRNLRMLLAKHRDSSEALKAAAKALDDPFPALRLAGATFAKDPQTLRALVSDASIDAGLRASALSELHDDDPETLAVALDSGAEELQAVALRAVAHAREVSLLPRVLALAGAGDVAAEAAAKALGAFDDPRVLPALLTLLLKRKSAAVQRAAAWSLGQVGTVDEVEPLMLFLDSPDAEVRETARLAIRRIQGRLGNPGEGRLSVVSSAEHGALSVAGPEGAVSLPEDE